MVLIIPMRQIQIKIDNSINANDAHNANANTVMTNDGYFIQCQ